MYTAASFMEVLLYAGQQYGEGIYVSQFFDLAYSGVARPRQKG
jgi:hypothetical protein